jgi:hypothetical protein
MKRARANVQASVLIALFSMFTPRPVRGDGGLMRLHETQGPFSVTVFVSPEAVLGGITDVSVLVQQKTNLEVVLDADVSLAVDPPNGLPMHGSELICSVSPATTYSPPGIGQQGIVQATREQASNKLLYAAALKLNATGDWRLHVYVSRGSDSARFDCPLSVPRTSAKPTGLWFCLAFPPIVVIAFAMNQWLRRNSLEKNSKSQSPLASIHAHPRETTKAGCSSTQRSELPQQHHGELIRANGF